MGAGYSSGDASMRNMRHVVLPIARHPGSARRDCFDFFFGVCTVFEQRCQVEAEKCLNIDVGREQHQISNEMQKQNL